MSAEQLREYRRQGLRPPGISHRFGDYLRRLVEMRSYAWTSARRGLESESASSALGQVWLLLQPALTIAILWVVFGVVLDLARGSDNYIAFLTVGISTFLFSQRAIMRGSNALINSSAILVSLSIPRAVMVLSQNLYALASYRYAVIVMLGVLPFMGAGPRLGWLLIAPLVLLQTMFNYGVSLLLAGPTTRYSDLRLALEYIFQILFYISGIFIPMSFFLDGEYADTLLTISAFNPFYAFCEASRWALLSVEPPDAGIIVGTVVGMPLLTVGVGLWTFWRNEVNLSGIQTLEA